MMDDWRERPYTVESNTSIKVIIGLAVALSFGAIGTYAYETGAPSSPPVQAVAAGSAAVTDADQTAAAQSPLPDTGPVAPAEPADKTAVDLAPAATPATEPAAKPVKVARVLHQPPEKAEIPVPPTASLRPPELLPPLITGKETATPDSGTAAAPAAQSAAPGPEPAEITAAPQ